MVGIRGSGVGLTEHGNLVVSWVRNVLGGLSMTH